MLARNKGIFIVLVVVAILLSIPLIAMWFTNEVDWSPFDFLLMGGLLLASGLAIEFVIRKVRTAGYRIALCLVILLALFLIWAELAVGIFGTPFAGS